MPTRYAIYNNLFDRQPIVVKNHIVSLLANQWYRIDKWPDSSTYTELKAIHEIDSLNRFWEYVKYRDYIVIDQYNKTICSRSHLTGNDFYYILDDRWLLEMAEDIANAPHETRERTDERYIRTKQYNPVDELLLDIADEQDTWWIKEHISDPMIVSIKNRYEDMLAWRVERNPSMDPIYGSEYSCIPAKKKSNDMLAWDTKQDVRPEDKPIFTL